MIAMQMQSLLASQGGQLANGSMTTRIIFPLTRLNKPSLRVNCMAKEEEEVKDRSNSALTPPKSNPIESQNKESTSLADLFAFSGPAPERINGRLAMIGFMTALGVELSKGKDLLAQITDGGAQWFIVTSIILSIASVVPLLKGENPEEDEDGWMNNKAELWNGRLAMLGLLALGLIEYVKGGALV